VGWKAALALMWAGQVAGGQAEGSTIRVE